MAKTGLTAKLNNSMVSGSWILSGDSFPTVGDNQSYTATFKADTGAENYEILTAPVTLTISKGQLTAKSGQISVTNAQAASYTYDLSQLLPDLTSGLTYGKVSFTLDGVELGNYYTANGKIDGSKLTLPINAVSSNEEKKVGTITVGISTDNYSFTPATISVSSSNKEVPQGNPALSKTELIYGAQLSEITLSGTMKNKNGLEVAGVFSWNTPNTRYSAGLRQAAWTFTPNDQNSYSTVSGSASITVKKAAGEGRVTMADWYYGDTSSEPVVNSSTNSTTNVSFSYKVRGADDNTYSQNKPSQVGSYTIRAIFVEGENYTRTTATADFMIKEKEQVNPQPSEGSESTNQGGSSTSGNTNQGGGSSTGGNSNQGGGSSTGGNTNQGGSTAQHSPAASSGSSQPTEQSSSTITGQNAQSGSQNITIPVTAQKTTVLIRATINDDIAVLQAIEKNHQEKLWKDKTESVNLEINLTGANRNIRVVDLPVQIIKSVLSAAENSAQTTDILTIYMGNGTVVLDKAAAQAVADQAAGNTVRLVLEKIDLAKLNQAQKESIREMKVYGGVSAYLICQSTNKYISDFRGGAAKLHIPFTVPNGFSQKDFTIFYIDEQGGKTQLNTSYVEYRTFFRLCHCP